MLYCLINYKTVTGIIESDDISELVRSNDMVINHVAGVEVGDTFDGSVFKKASKEHEQEIRQKEQREYGQSILNDLIDKMGARNLKLASDGIIVNTIQISQDNAGIKLLIETGALKTASDVCHLMKMKYPTHADLYNETITKIVSWLTIKGYL